MAEIPQVGKKAPAFTLPASTGTKIKLSDYAGKQNVILYFYPRDNTPGCTQEACDFRDNLAQLQTAETAVLGISTDSIASHQKFAEKFTLPFPLLADEDHAVSEKYGVWGEKKNYGKSYQGLHRTTFLIGRDGKIKNVWTNVKVKGHVMKVLERIQQLREED